MRASPARRRLAARRRRLAARSPRHLPPSPSPLTPPPHTSRLTPPASRSRAEIFRVHLSKLKLADDIDEVSKTLASLTPGFSGAEVANVCNEGALVAARANKEAVEIADFHAAADRVIGGLERKSKVLSEEDRTRVAHHEAGHAVTGWFLKHANPLLKVSIVPRGMAALGYAQYVPKERKLYTREQMMDTMCMMLGGRIAEILFFGKQTQSTGAQVTGRHAHHHHHRLLTSPTTTASTLTSPHLLPPQDDLQKVTRLAYDIVTNFGMSEKVGHRSYPPPSDGQLASQRPYSEETAQIVDEEVRIGTRLGLRASHTRAAPHTTHPASSSLSRCAKSRRKRTTAPTLCCRRRRSSRASSPSSSSRRK